MNMKSFFITSAAISILFSGVSAAADKTIYVDDSATGANNGSSWLNAYTYLQDALAAASTGDQILVAQGIYRPDRGQGITPGDRSSRFQPANGVTIRGGYAGCNAPDPDARDIRSYETILSGDLDGNDVEVADPAELLYEPTRAENSCNVVVASGCDRTTLLEGLTITGGNGNGAMLSGAGIYNGKPTVSLCKIVANSAAHEGGGIYFEHAAHEPGALLKDSTISHNSANSGGGVYGCAEVVNCTFTDNAAVDGYAGALNLGSDCETTVTDCIFTRNYAAQSAGAVYLDASGTEVTFTRCSFIANSSADKGGAIYADGCTCGSYSTFYQCKFIGNNAGSDGGAICDYGFTDMQLYSCLLVGNSAVRNGGALCDEYDGGSALINCTVSSNTAAGQGGGVCYDNYSYKGRRLANTIIWANSDKNGRTDPYSQIYLIEVSELQDVTHCCIQVIPPEIAGQGNTTSDPLFVDADGPDNVPGNEDDNLHLLGGSPCVDTGHNEYVAPQSSDLDGNPRIINGAVDRGAYEKQDGAPPTGIIYVDDSATGANNGSSWANAFKTLQVGILTASSGNEIRVAQGIYKPNDGVVGDTPDDRLITFQLKNGVTIKGGYAGFGQPDPDNRNIEGYKTILTGDIRGNDVDVSDPCFLPSEPSRMDNNYHVVTGSGTNETAVLDGFTITGGHARESGGGGMCNINGSPTVKGCTFLKNSAYALESGAQGGGIYNEYGSPGLVECKFIMNAVDVGIPDHGSGNGGAIADTHSSPKIINCTFIRNVAMGNNGGAVYHSGGSAEITDCTFEHNAARRYGGGVCNWSGDSRVTGCTFVRNSSAGGGGLYNSFNSSSITGCKFTENVGSGFGGGALSDSGGTFSGCTFSSNFSGVRGGGMYISAGSPTVTGCKFVRNISGDGGGGVYIESDGSPLINDCVFSENSIYDGSGGGLQNLGSLTLISCRFTNNSAPWCIGGGMSNEGDSTLTNCIFAENSSGYGAGIHSTSGTATLINCLLNKNLATNWGGGLCSVGSTVLLVNCTFAANSSPVGSGLACRSPINVPDSNVTITNCILWDQNGEIWIDDDSTVAVTYSDIQGGWHTGEGNVDTDPLFMNQAGGNYHLRPNSPCTNAGNNSAVPSGVTTDLDSKPRIINGTVDMGAYEFVAVPEWMLYDIIDLGTLGGQESMAYAINNYGQIVGCAAKEDGTQRATLFDYTGTGNNIDLGTLGGNGSCAYSINILGDAVGAAADETGHYHAALFDTGDPSNNTNLAGPDNDLSRAWAINDHGQIVGTARVPSWDWKATLFDPTGAGNNIDLGAGLENPYGSDAICAWSINNKGQIVGYAFTGTTSIRDRAILFDPSGRGNSIILTPGDDGGQAYCINDAGQIVGWSARTGAALFDPTGQGNNIGLGGGMPGALSINNRGRAVGTVTYYDENDDSFALAVLFDSTGAGNSKNLNELIDRGTGWILEAANGVNDNGWIVGYGINPHGSTRAFVLIPKGQQPALVAHWKLDESEGDTAKDSAGANDGALHGGPQWQPYSGRLEGALLFDGENDYVNCGNSPTFDITGQISVGAWVNINSVNMEWQTVIAKGDSAWRLSTARDEYRYCFAVTGGPPWNYINGEIEVAANEWHHVCGTYDGANLRLYIDGVEDPAGPVPELNGVTTDDYDVYIGENQERPGRYWDGLIDDVRVYNYALTHAQVFNLCKPGVLYVDSDAPGANNGSGWADAFKCLQDALAAATDGTEIRVAQGAYRPDRGAGITPGDRQATFHLKNGVAIKGGYAGFGQPQPNARDINLYETILSGDLAGNDVDVNDPEKLGREPTRSENAYHVVTGTQTNETAVIDGFTITAGNADYYDFSLCNGPGMFNDHGSPTILNCTFIANFAGNNDGGGAGGAMFNLTSHPTITNCRFVRNAAIALDGGEGSAGAVFNENSNPRIADCTFIGNVAGRDGGAMYNYGSNPTLTNCEFIGNLAREGGSGSYGGAVWNYGSNPVFTNCLFAGNKARSSQIGSGGGAIGAGCGSVTIINCTFSGNAAEQGGAIYSYGHYEAYFSLTNSILWNDTPDEIYTPTTGPIVKYCDVQDGPPGEGNVAADPCFVAPGYWDDDSWINGDYHLKSFGWRWDAAREQWVFDRVTSRCIDAGNPGSPLADEPLTIPDDPNNEYGCNLRIDMGAYGGTAEASIPPYDWAILGDLNNDGAVDWLDFVCAGSDWLETAPHQPGDLNRNGDVNPADLDLFADDWLKTTIWRK